MDESGYLDLLRNLLENGNFKSDRTGTGVRSLFGAQLRFNLQDSFPLLTTKKVHFKSVAHELLWFLKGDTNVKYLQDNGVRIWNEWARPNGDLGPIYGKQWRRWGDEDSWVDQIVEVECQLRSNPNSRRHLVVSWNPLDIPSMALPPCHCLFQFYVNDGKLSCQLYQRSADVFLGVPFNIASYSLLTCMVAKSCGYTPAEFVWTGGDVHLYENHVEQAKIQLTRGIYTPPRLKLTKRNSVLDYAYTDITIEDYVHHAALPAKVAV